MTCDLQLARHHQLRYQKNTQHPTVARHPAIAWRVSGWVLAEPVVLQGLPLPLELHNASTGLRQDRGTCQVCLELGIRPQEWAI